MFSTILFLLFSHFKLSFGYSTNSIAGAGMNFSANSITGGGSRFSPSEKKKQTTTEEIVSELEKELNDVNVQIAFLQGKKSRLETDIKKMKGGS